MGKYTDIILEDMNAKYDILLELIGTVLVVVKNQPTREEFNELRDRVITIEGVLTQMGPQVTDHERRITKLESIKN